MRPATPSPSRSKPLPTLLAVLTLLATLAGVLRSPSPPQPEDDAATAVIFTDEAQDPRTDIELQGKDGDVLLPDPKGTFLLPNGRKGESFLIRDSSGGRVIGKWTFEPGSEAPLAVPIDRHE
ncbi:MAG TPA: hypothetical protein ENJ09_04605 [Planctomycetes bacterium]|nr:hypothetical protein [Planctomycetota bacterium]